MAVTSFLLLVVPVHLNDVEDEANDGDDQQTQLNGVRKCDHKLPLLSLRTEGLKKRLPFWYESEEDTPLAVYRQHPYR